VVNGDHILYILATRMAKSGNLVNNAVVTTVMSNLGLYRALDRVGIGHVQTDVGDRFVYENMRQTGNALGGEQSGHIIIRKYATAGDGILTAILLMDAVLSEAQPLSKLAAPVCMLPQLTQNLTVSDREAVMRDPLIREKLSAMTEALAGGGRILLRKSGTEPVIRIMAEAECDEECRRLIDELAATIRERGY
jgi:phosphoglucosamine mutase